MRLTEAKVRRAPPGRHGDEYGLSLLVKPSGRRSWTQRLTINRKRRDSGLGAYPEVSLAEARRIAFDRWQSAKDGRDPERSMHTPTFSNLARIYIAGERPSWKNAKHAWQWENTLESYVFPFVGEKHVSEIRPGDIRAILMQPVTVKDEEHSFWLGKRETAQRVAQRMSRILDFAEAMEFIKRNPVPAIVRSLPRRKRQRRHMAALEYQRINECVTAVRSAPRALHTVKLGLEFLILTAARCGEVRHCRWEEFDLDAAVWTVPGHRMKMGREHRVPLSDRAREILAEAAELSDGTGLVFPGRRTGRVLSENTFRKLLNDLGFPVTAHGMRATFRIWASENTATPHAVMEQALAHAIKNASEAAYARSDLLDKRRPLMQEWASFVATGPSPDTTNVVDFKAREAASA